MMVQEPQRTSAGGEQVLLAAAACDYCRQKKKKCSKELPKCSNCVPWPGPCVYSKAARRSETPLSVRSLEQNRELSSATSAAGVSSEGQSLHVQEGGQHREHESVQTPTSFQSSQGRSHPEQPLTDNQVFRSSEGTECFISNTHTFMPALSLSGIDEPDSGVLSKEAMQVLLNSFANFQVPEIDEQSPNRTGGVFYVPEPPTTRSLAYQVRNVMNQGDFMFLNPPIQAIEQALLDPTGTRPRGRVLTVYHILHTISASLDAQSNTTKAFSWNVQMALNDSTLFLTPCEENLQALLMLAVHGEDRFACPNLSWMLVGQATQQAKAIGLHLPSPGAGFDYQRRLSLFWSLFVVDKSVSLAFGRPEFLEADHYQNVPLPDATHLNKFSPHSTQTQASPSVNGFGQCFFLSNITLAKFISRYNSTIRRGNVTEAQIYRKELEIWFDRAIAELDLKMKSEVDHSDASVREMRLGIDTFRFQFLHLMVLLQRNLGSRGETVYTMSRIVLSMLPGLVSNSSGVYNGIVWQLLYYPFTSFFVIFERILNCEPACRDEEDLQLMRKMVYYYFDMSNTLGPLRKLASKLGATAQVFCKIAERASVSNQQSNGIIQDEVIKRFLDSYPAMRPALMGTQFEGEMAAHPEDHLGFGQMQLDADGGIDWFLWESHDVPVFPFL